MGFNLTKTEQNQIAFNIFLKELETMEVATNRKWHPIEVAQIDSILGSGWRLRGADDWHGGPVFTSIKWTEAAELWERCQAEQTRIELQQMINAQPRQHARSI